MCFSVQGMYSAVIYGTLQCENGQDRRKERTGYGSCTQRNVSVDHRDIAGSWLDLVLFCKGLRRRSIHAGDVGGVQLPQRECMSVTVYIKPEKNIEVCRKEVFLSQIADVWCRDKSLEAKCKAIKVMTIGSNREERYVIPGIKLVELIQQVDPRAEVTNLGEQDMIIDYQPKAHKIGMLDWIKTAFVCLIVFFGGAFAIMTFNNDGSVSDIFKDVDQLVVGNMTTSSASDSTGEAGMETGQKHEKKSAGVMLLEISYSVGLILGVTLFFNHFGKRKVTLDPTPIEVQMRLYEEQVETTVIRNASRKESGVDTQ